MKLLVLLFLVGYATASVYKELDDAADELHQKFMLGLEQAGSFSEAAGLPYEHPILKKAEEDTKTELGKKLRETLDEILEKVKDSIEKGKGVREDLKDKLKEVKQKLKDMGEDVGDKAKDLMEKIKEKAKKFWEDLLEKLKGDQKRSIHEPMAAFEMKEIFQKLKKIITDKIDKEALKNKIHELFGKGNEIAENLVNVINEKGDKYKDKLLDLVDRYLRKDESKRSIQELWEKVKDYFKDMHIEIKEKYLKFGEWVKNNFKEHVQTGKDKIENIKNIAREFIDKAKDASKDVAIEAQEFLKPYKDDLGSLWKQVKETVKDIVNRED